MCADSPKASISQQWTMTKGMSYQANQVMALLSQSSYEEGTWAKTPYFFHFFLTDVA
jgi:hypothetical protein